MNPLQKYRQSAVQSAPQNQIVILLLEEAVKRLSYAEAVGVSVDALPTYIGHLQHVREILLELSSALDFDAAPALCAHLHPLYSWCNEELRSAGTNLDPGKLPPIQHALQTLLAGWRAAAT